MEIKKNPKASLEKLRGTFILIGLVGVLLVVTYILNYSQANVKVKDMTGNINANVEEEQVLNTVQDVKPPPPPPPTEQISEIIEIVDDNKVINDIDFTTEIDETEDITFEDMDIPEDEPVVDEAPLVWAEQMPKFKGGGEAGLRAFIAKNVIYPEQAIENEIQGTVYARFVVTKSGKVGEVQIVRGVDPLLNEEAKRVIKKLPNFTPGSQGGRPVSVWFSVPIVFQLND